MAPPSTSGPVGTGTLAINGGVLSSNSTTARSITNAITFGGNSTLGNATNTGALTLTGTGTLSATRNLTIDSAVSYNGVIGDGGNGFGIAKLGAGTLTFSGTSSHTYTGQTDVQAGTLEIGASNVLANASTLRVSGGAVSLTTFSDTIAGVQLTSGSITGTTGVLTSTTAFDVRGGSASAILGGSVGLTKTTAGTVTLSGANTYSGGTSITGGTLALGTTGSINNSPTINIGTGASFDVSAVSGGYSLSSGQTLLGIGTVIGSMTVASGSTISPGNSPGNLSVGGTTFASGGNYNWQMLSAAGTAGTDWDLLTVAGALNITATSGSKFNLNLWTLSSIAPDVSGEANNFNPATNYAWKIVGASSISGFDPDKFAINTAAINGAGGFANGLSGGTFTISQSGGDLNLNFLAAASGNDLYWDGSGNWVTSAPGAGGNGTWADATGGWDPSKKANFSGTAGSVTVTTASANKGLNFLADGYSLTGGTLTLSSTGADNIITVGSGMTTTLSSAIATSAGIIKSGAGTLIFDTTQSYTGGTTINSGTLTLGHATNTLSDTEAVSISGTLALGANNDTVGSLTLAGGSITGSGTLTAPTYTLSGGTVSANLGAGAATSSTGTTTLNGTLAADLAVSGGTVNLGASERLSNTSALAISSGTFGISTFDETVGSFTLSSTGILSGSTGILTAPAYALQGGTLNARLGAGPVTVTTATTTLGSAGRLTASSSLDITSGQLSLGGNESVASFSITAGTLGGSGTLTAPTYTLSGGTVSADLGSGLATSSTETTTLNGTLAGDLTVSGGTVNLGAADRLSNTSAIAVSSGTLGISTFNDTVGSFTLSGTGTLGGTTGILTTAAYALQGGFVNARLGAGAITVSTATTTLGSAGRLTASSTLAIPSGQLSLGGDESVASLSLTGGTLGGSGVLTAPTYTLSGGTVSANLGSGAATAGTGSTALNGTLAGSLAVTGGTVTLGSADRIGNSSAVSVSSGSLDLGGFSDAVGPVTLSGGSITNGTLTGSSYALTGGTLSANLAGSGPITSASGTTTLSGDNTAFSGPATISGGTVNLATSTSLGSSAVTITGGSLLVGADIVISNNITVAAVSPSSLLITQYYEGPSTNKWIELTNIGGSTLDLATQGFYLAHFNNANAEGYKTNVAPNFSMALSGTLTAGQSILLGNTGNPGSGYAASFTPRVNDNSVINFNGNDSIVLYSSNTFTSANILDAIGFTNSGNEGVDKSFVRTSIGQGYNTTTGSNATTFASIRNSVTNAVVDGATAGTEARLGFSSLTAGPPAVVTLGSTSPGLATYSGNVTLTSGVTLTAATGGTSAFTGIISGPGSITKTGTGIVNLAGANTYSGNTTVSAGTLLVNNTTGSGTGTGSLLIQPTATLGGTGTISGPTTIQGSHSPGNSPGIQTFGSDLTYSGGASVVNWELTGNTITGRGTSFDGIDVGGNLAFLDPTTLTLTFNGPGSSVNWTDALWGSTQSWLLYSLTSGTISGFGNLSISGSDWADAALTPNLLSTARPLWGFNLSTTGNDIYLNYVAIPEPSRTLFLALGLLTLTLRRRR